MRLIIVIAALLLLLIAGSSCLPTDISTAKAEVSVISKELKPDGEGKTALLITVKNTGRVKADLVEVAVKFYDADKNLLDANRDCVMTLNGGETWEFTIPCNSPAAKVASYEIETTAGASSE